jgi:hypothetical protein
MKSAAAQAPSRVTTPALAARTAGRAVAARKPPAVARRLQAALGNQGLQRLFQAKLTVSGPHDPLEQEADRVADLVVRQPGPSPSAARPGAGRAAPPLQRRCRECEEDEPALHAKLEGAATDDREVGPEVDLLPSGGQPLTPSTRAFMEPRFGADFSGVRVHADARADRAAESVRALAYTVGHRLVFRAGHYQPESAPGRRLLAHELTHVVQQGAAAAARDGRVQPAAGARGSLQRQPATAGRREARITVVFDDDSEEFLHRVMRAIQRSAAFRGIEVSFGQPFHEPILALHRRLMAARTAKGTRVAVRASVFHDPAEYHEELTDGRVEVEQEARVRETKITAVMTPRDNFAGRSLTRLGIAEVVDLSFTATPAATAADLGGLEWDQYRGVGTLVSSPRNDGTAVFTAGAAPGQIGFDLLIASGLAAGRRVATLNLFAVAPDDGVMERIPGSGIQHLHDTCGVGVCLRIFLRPVDVSFQNIWFSEGDGVSTATGFYKSLDNRRHCATNICHNQRAVLGGNSTTGCKVSTGDNAATPSWGPPYKTGTFLWPIAQQYAVGTGPWVPFTTFNQEHVSDAAGRATIWKGGSTPVSRNAADPTSIVNCGAFPV